MVAPTFPSTTDTTLEIAENTAAGENIGTAVSATDPDTADGDTDVNPDDVNVNTLTYSLKDANDPTSDDAAFDIDAGTGQLKTEAALDYETTTSYTVTVTASDGEHSVSIDVTVNITDVDEVQPTVTITGPTTTQKDKFEVTITFSEGVTGFTASDISLTTTLTEGTGNATVALKNATDGDSVYTAEITPPTNAEGSIDIQVPAGVAQDEVNLDNIISPEFSVEIDTKSPTVTLTGPSDTQTGVFEITITFTEAVSGFTQEDISLTDSTATVTATLKNATDGDSAYTAEITPTTGGNVNIKIDAAAAEDTAGNGNIASETLTVLSTVDRPDPIMYVKQDDVVQHSQTVAIKPFELTIKFGQPVTGFEQSDLRLTGNSNVDATITGWEESSDSKTYTVTVTPRGEGSVTFTIPANVTHAADDGQGNVKRKLYVKVDEDHDPAGDETEDETAPRVRTIKTPSDMQSSAFDVTITFSESVTGFEMGDITLSGSANASVTALTGSGSVYTATITPEADAAGDVVIQVSAGAVKDKAENENPASRTYSVRVNLTRPTVAITNVPTDPQNSAFSVIITFSKSVTGFEAGDIALGGTANASVTALTGSEGVYTATITPTRSGEVSIQVRPNAARDSGNRGNIASSTHTVSADLTRPTVVITDVPTATQSGHFFVTITFSEPVTGFTASDISLTNATATLNRTGDSTFTASITPKSSGNVSIQVPENVAQDAAQNGNGASQSHTVLANLGEDSGSVEIDDRLDPIMAVRQNGIENSDQTVAPGTFQLIMDFGQPVTGFERSELAIFDFNTGATITGWQRSADGVSYTATVQVSNTGGLTFTVPANAAQAEDDGRGNPERKFTVLVREAEHSGAPMVREGPPLPNETLLFSNYPNPFNPETWIPYQLAQDADVQILIYDVHGTMVRRLTLGHRSAGFYTNRARSAHWDGRNSFGEEVANGVYFYQLHAGDISPLRKMLILK